MAALPYENRVQLSMPQGNHCKYSTASSSITYLEVPPRWAEQAQSHCAEAVQSKKPGGFTVQRSNSGLENTQATK